MRNLQAVVLAIVLTQIVTAQQTVIATQTQGASPATTLGSPATTKFTSLSSQAQTSTVSKIITSGSQESPVPLVKTKEQILAEQQQAIIDQKKAEALRKQKILDTNCPMVHYFTQSYVSKPENLAPKMSQAGYFLNQCPSFKGKQTCCNDEVFQNMSNWWLNDVKQNKQVEAQNLKSYFEQYYQINYELTYKFYSMSEMVIEFSTRMKEFVMEYAKLTHMERLKAEMANIEKIKEEQIKQLKEKNENSNDEKSNSAQSKIEDLAKEKINDVKSKIKQLGELITGKDKSRLLSEDKSKQNKVDQLRIEPINMKCLGYANEMIQLFGKVDFKKEFQNFKKESRQCWKHMSEYRKNSMCMACDPANASFYDSKNREITISNTECAKTFQMCSPLATRILKFTIPYLKSYGNIYKCDKYGKEKAVFKNRVFPTFDSNLNVQLIEKCGKYMNMEQNIMPEECQQFCITQLVLADLNELTEGLSYTNDMILLRKITSNKTEVGQYKPKSLIVQQRLNEVQLEAKIKEQYDALTKNILQLIGKYRIFYPKYYGPKAYQPIFDQQKKLTIENYLVAINKIVRDNKPPAQYIFEKGLEFEGWFQKINEIPDFESSKTIYDEDKLIELAYSRRPPMKLVNGRYIRDYALESEMNRPYVLTKQEQSYFDQFTNNSKVLILYKRLAEDYKNSNTTGLSTEMKFEAMKNFKMYYEIQQQILLNKAKVFRNDFGNQWVKRFKEFSINTNHDIARYKVNLYLFYKEKVVPKLDKEAQQKFWAYAEKTKADHRSKKVTADLEQKCESSSSVKVVKEEVNEVDKQLNEIKEKQKADEIKLQQEKELKEKLEKEKLEKEKIDKQKAEELANMTDEQKKALQEQQENQQKKTEEQSNMAQELSEKDKQDLKQANEKKLEEEKKTADDKKAAEAKEAEQLKKTDQSQQNESSAPKPSSNDVPDGSGGISL